MRIPIALRQEMLAHIQSCLPEEACGILGGTSGEARRAFLVENELHSPVRYRMRAEIQLQALLQLEEESLDLVGIFHSHPTSPAYPSPTDLAEFAYPEALTLIWAPVGGSWQMRAFWIDGSQVTEVEIVE